MTNENTEPSAHMPPTSAAHKAAAILADCDYSCLLICSDGKDPQEEVTKIVQAAIEEETKAVRNQLAITARRLEYWEARARFMDKAYPAEIESPQQPPDFKFAVGDRVCRGNGEITIAARMQDATGFYYHPRTLMPTHLWFPEAELKSLDE